MLNRDSNTLWDAHIARQRPLVIRRWHGLAIALAGALAAASAAFIAALFLLPAAMVFPVTGSALVFAAASFALIAWASPAEVGGSRLVFWDISGALAVIGLCAALFGEPEQAVALLDRDRM
jgi:hypothetical protein